MSNSPCSTDRNVYLCILPFLIWVEIRIRHPPSSDSSLTCFKTLLGLEGVHQQHYLPQEWALLMDIPASSTRPHWAIYCGQPYTKHVLTDQLCSRAGYGQVLSIRLLDWLGVISNIEFPTLWIVVSLLNQVVCNFFLCSPFVPCGDGSKERSTSLLPNHAPSFKTTSSVL